ncbi:hypothetical protein D9611_003668 [Ephemerocybe angulata]|uniref:BTB domain-containing protein n=1 Tax=Ephemerocybe angulata TaxID=980116 RepID=A0A8H5B614_9AGAR|nr:hypothetical protein D9611_003668 [Tulosesus angulatus]
MTTAACDMARTISPPRYIIDEEYYWNLIKFSVGDHVFRVPKHRFLTDSEIFATTYGLDRAQVSGSEDEFTAEDPMLDAVSLDVEPHEFRIFLKTLYPKQLQGELTLTPEEWLAVLKLSTKWLFNDFRKMAIEKLSPLAEMDPIEKVRIGKEFCVEAWLLSGYCELVNRDESITVGDAGKLGWQSAIRLCGLREDWKIPGRRDPIAKAIPANLDSEIEIAFRDKFEAIREAQSLYMTVEDRTDAERKRQAEEKEAKDVAERKEQEERMLAQHEAERRRIELAAEEERKRVDELAKELEERRQLLQSLKSDVKPAPEILLFAAPMAPIGFETDSEDKSPKSAVPESLPLIEDEIPKISHSEKKKKKKVKKRSRSGEDAVAIPPVEMVPTEPAIEEVNVEAEGLKVDEMKAVAVTSDSEVEAGDLVAIEAGTVL